MTFNTITILLAKKDGTWETKKFSVPTDYADLDDTALVRYLQAEGITIGPGEHAFVLGRGTAGAAQHTIVGTRESSYREPYAVSFLEGRRVRFLVDARGPVEAIAKVLAMSEDVRELEPEELGAMTICPITVQNNNTLVQTVVEWEVVPEVDTDELELTPEPTTPKKPSIN